jgi:hypothetical protein
MLSRERIFLLCLLAFVCALLVHPSARAQIDWQPIDPADLAMKDEPLAPGAPAIYLYRAVKRNDLLASEYRYYRIKILTEAGKDQANVVIEYSRAHGSSVGAIQGRTIHPDGTIIPWEGKALDQVLEHAHHIKYFAKTFALPDVQVGSIIEYRYSIGWDNYWLLATTWQVNEGLFTRQLHCTLQPYNKSYNPFDLFWQTQRVPYGKAPQQTPDGLFHFDAQNIPGIEEEPFMPPESSIEGRVDFYYTESATTDETKYWRKVGKDRDSEIEKFVGHYKSIEEEAARVVQSNDAPETKLRKLYARAEQLRYLSSEPSKTADQIKQENLKDNKSVEDVLKNGYAWGDEIDWFFLALVRAAGFQASPVMVSSRADYFFNRKILDRDQLDAEVVAVSLNGQDVFLDPASKHCPYGILPWPKTGVQGIKLDKDGGTFVNTTLPKSSDASIERIATLSLGDDGWLHGKLIVSFSGQGAYGRRDSAENEDDATRNKKLTDEVTSWLPAGATLTLTNSPDWAGSEAPLRFEFDVKTHYVGTSTGRRVIMSETLLTDAWIPNFEHPARTYPVYFANPWELKDEVTLTLPLQMKMEDSAAPVDLTTPFGIYHLSCEKQPAALHFVRQISESGIYYDVQYYTDIRSFFEKVRSDDTQQVVLETQ